MDISTLTEIANIQTRKAVKGREWLGTEDICQSAVLTLLESDWEHMSPALAHTIARKAAHDEIGRYHTREFTTNEHIRRGFAKTDRLVRTDVELGMELDEALSAHCTATTNDNKGLTAEVYKNLRENRSDFAIADMDDQFARAWEANESTGVAARVRAAIESLSPEEQRVAEFAMAYVWDAEGAPSMPGLRTMAKELGMTVYKVSKALEAVKVALLEAGL